MADEFDALYQPFQSVDEIERFYSDPKHDMTRSADAMAYARNNPDKYKRALYHCAPFMEESQYKRRDICLWRYLWDSLGGQNKWLPQYQKRGTCVGQGGKLGCDALMAINHRFGGGQWKGRSAVADKYAGGRVDIGNQPGRWDGSTGFWLVAWMERFGSVLLKDLGLPDDARDQDENIAVQWAASRSGVPSEYEDIARERPVVDTYVVESTDEAEVVLDAGGLLITCSSLIATGQRGKYGISPLRNQGGHCQLVWGKYYVDGQRIWNQQNSWSERWGSGTRYPDDMPVGSVNLTDSDLQRQLRSGDCHAIVGIKGLEPIRDEDVIYL